MNDGSRMTKEELKQAKKDAKALLKKPFYKKWWVWTIAAIVLIAMATGGEEGSNTANEAEKLTEVSSDVKEEEKETPKEEKKEEPKAEEVAGMGEVVRVGDVEFTVHGVSTSKQVGGTYGTKAQGTFLLVDVTVTNVGNEAITTDSNFFQLLVGEKTYDADSSASLYANPDANFFFEQVNPDLSAKGSVVFDVSDAVIENPDLLLKVQTGFFGTETGTIKIAK